MDYWSFILSQFTYDMSSSDGIASRSYGLTIFLQWRSDKFLPMSKRYLSHLFYGQFTMLHDLIKVSKHFFNRFGRVKDITQTPDSASHIFKRVDSPSRDVGNISLIKFVCMASDFCNKFTFQKEKGFVLMMMDMPTGTYSWLHDILKYSLTSSSLTS